MTDEQYRQHCRALLAEFTQNLVTRTDQLSQDHPLRELAGAYLAVLESTEDFYGKGSALVARLFDTYPDFAPIFPRELLWFFGGDCLHYMPDEEIAEFQQLEELRLAAARRGETFNIRESRAKLLKLQ
tara:strand:+ start:708 stop:1091 length:384 start_codon:yes stop_codon:yes gene_type:complete